MKMIKLLLVVFLSLFISHNQVRTEDFQKAIDNPNIKAIWSGRGGYGTVRILDRLDFTKFRESPKWIIGYSDITALHSHLNTLGYETIHAMMGTSLGDDPEEITATIKTFKKAIFGEQLSYSLVSTKENREGSAKGQLIGGNISLLVSMLGSKSQMNAEDKI